MPLLLQWRRLASRRWRRLVTVLTRRRSGAARPGLPAAAGDAERTERRRRLTRRPPRTRRNSDTRYVTAYLPVRHPSGMESSVSRLVFVIKAFLFPLILLFVLSRKLVAAAGWRSAPQLLRAVVGYLLQSVWFRPDNVNKYFARSIKRCSCICRPLRSRSDMPTFLFHSLDGSSVLPGMSCTGVHTCNAAQNPRDT